MLTLKSIPGAQYPVAHVAAPMERIQGLLPGVSLASDGEYIKAPYWYAPELAEVFGVAPDDYTQHHLHELLRWRHNVAAIKSGRHPSIDRAPADLYRHQKEAWALMMAVTSFAFFHEPGLGKTRSIIEGLRSLWHRHWEPPDPNEPLEGRPPRHGPTLVIGEPTLLYDTWEGELERWAGWRVESKKTPAAHVLNLNTNPEYVTHSGAWAYPVFLISRQSLVQRPATMRELAATAGIVRVVVDESASMKNHETLLPQQLLNDIWAYIPERYLMSGLPAPNNEMEYWAQMQFVAPGLLPTTFDAFKDEFFESAPDEEYYKLRGRRFILKGSRKNALTDRLATVSVFRSKDDCTDIPKPNFIPRYVDLPSEPRNIRAAYQVLEGELQAELGKLKGATTKKGAKRSLGHVFARIMKIRQLCSGYIVDSEENWVVVHDLKFRLLQDTIDQLDGRQAVIWMNFDKDFETAARKLRKDVINSAGFVWGKTANRQYRKDTLDLFRAGGLRYLFANPHSIQKGLTLFDPKAQAPCHNAIYFNFDYSFEAFQQSQDRLIRIGQWIPVNVWMLICRHTREEEIYQRLRYRRGDADEVLELLK